MSHEHKTYLTPRQKIVVGVFLGIIMVVGLPPLVYMVCLGAWAYQMSRKTETEEALKTRLEANDALPKLKAWALERIKTQRWRGTSEELGKLPVNADDLRINIILPYPGWPRLCPWGSAASTIAAMSSPSPATPLSAGSAAVVGNSHILECIQFEFGGGLRGPYGIFIGPLGFTPKDVPWPHLNRWDESVWYYDNINWKRR
jgi:hypothetical protein